MNKLAETTNLVNKNILITGASSGIGRQCAIDASRLGANVVLVARNTERLNETMSLMKKGNHLIIVMDITEIDKIPMLADEVLSRLGLISGFIHSAGIEMTLPLKFVKKEHYEKMFLINVIAGFEFIKVFSNKKYVSEKASSFVLISSVMSIVGSPGKTVYCACKGAIVSGVKAMALELSGKNIRVNSISPGIVETEMIKKMFDKLTVEAKDEITKMHPLGLGKPEDIAALCMFLISESSRWITGTNIVIDGGYSVH